MAPHPRVAGACGRLHNFMKQGPQLVWRSRGNPSRPAGKTNQSAVIEEKILIFTEWEIKILRKPEFGLNNPTGSENVSLMCSGARNVFLMYL